MDARVRFTLGFTMSLALLFGFLHVVWPESPVSLKRLHIFLFNLCAGGSLILYYTQGAGRISKRVYAFFGLSLLHALSAASHLYLPALVLSVPLIIIVESIRITRFSLFPLNFFNPRTPTHEKFNQASLLCLSLGILISSLVIMNNQYFGWASYQKLSLDVFFLGYSFPISLITMSIMFYFLRDSRGRLKTLLKETTFWVVNLGVISFFVFIILESFVPEIAAASLLTVMVVVIFILFLKNAPQVQQKIFLVSGMVFLLLTAITGVLYIARYFFPELDKFTDLFLVVHATISLYGWNLSGLFIIIRFNDFPIKLNSALSIALHWAIVMLLAPLAKYYPILALIAVPAYVVLLSIVFMSRGTRIPKTEPVEVPDKFVIVTGATGLIGSRIIEILAEKGIQVVAFARDPEGAQRLLGERVVCQNWDFEHPEHKDWQRFIGRAEGIIHLAGTPLFARRWTGSFKRKMEESRVQGTRQLVEAIQASDSRPKSFVSASALGIYGIDPEKTVDENAPAADDLLARICVNWEAEARKLDQIGVRNVQIRVGIVLARQAGALKEMLLPFRLGLGGVIGHPHHWINWIHLDDIANVFVTALMDEKMAGPYNAAAPNPVSMRDFAKTLGRVLRRPALMRYPVSLLKLVIGPAADFTSGGSRVVVEKIQKAGVRFGFEDLEMAMRDVLKT
jgi:uncharacterized protein (TIGR01777 family)